MKMLKQFAKRPDVENFYKRGLNKQSKYDEKVSSHCTVLHSQRFLVQEHERSSFTSEFSTYVITPFNVKL